MVFIYLKKKSDDLNDTSQSNIKILLINIKYINFKYSKLGVKRILISDLIYTTEVLLEVLKRSDSWFLF